MTIVILSLKILATCDETYFAQAFLQEDAEGTEVF
jgi:hypothetical protein